MSTKEEFLTTACLLSQGDGRITFGFSTRLKIQVAPATVPCNAQVFARPCPSASLHQPPLAVKLALGSTILLLSN